MKVQPLPEAPSDPAASFRDLVDGELDAFLAHQEGELGSLAPEALTLLDEIRRILRAGGKRIRPLFCYWGYRAGGGEATPAAPILRAGGAIELLHTSALIHDDVMDRSHSRRGEATTFRRLAGATEHAEPEHFGRSAAILAGDLAQALADRMLARSGFPAERVLAAFGPFNRMRTEATCGQYLDLLASGGSPDDEGEARRVAAMKSGSYTVVGPLLVGATLSGAGSDVREELARYGRPLGEAFQLRDDVLGTFGDPSLTGKDRDSDIREGKRTVLVAKAWHLGTAEARRIIAERLGRPGLEPAAVEEVRAAIRESGALAGTIALIDALAEQAKAALSGRAVPPDVSTELRALADRVAVRDA